METGQASSGGHRFSSCHVLIAIFRQEDLLYQKLTSNLWETIKMVSMNLKVQEEMVMAHMNT